MVKISLKNNVLIGGIITLAGILGCEKSPNQEKKNVETTLTTKEHVSRQEPKLELEILKGKDLKGRIAVVYSPKGEPEQSYSRIVESYPDLRIFRIPSGDQEAEKLFQGKKFMLLYENGQAVERLAGAEGPSILEQELCTHFGGEIEGKTPAPLYFPGDGPKCNLGLKAGDTAPSFTAEKLDGKSISLEDVKGKIVYIEFGASWSNPSNARIPETKKLYEKFKDKNFKMIWVAMESEREPLAAFVKDKQLPYDVIFEEDESEGIVPTKYQVKWFPQAYLIDRQGKIAVRGFPNENDIEKLLK